MVEVALADELLGLLLRTRERDEVLDGYVARVVDVEVLGTYGNGTVGTACLRYRSPL